MSFASLLLLAALGAPSTSPPPAVDLTGRWRMNPDLSDPMPAPPADRADARPGGGRPGGGMGGRGGMGGGRGGGAMPGSRRGGDRPDPEQMARTRDAMRAVLEAPAEMIVTRHEDEVVFTSGTGEIIRVLVTGRKMKTTAGGAEHEVKAAYKAGTLTIERDFGRVKVLDTYRISADGRQLERVTKVGDRPIRRVYDRID